jgi:hypothetical protein
MTLSAVEELARQLKSDYENAPPNRKVASIHLFGIANAAALQGVSKHDVAERAGIGRSYGVELNKAVVLAEYVKIVKPLV